MCRKPHSPLVPLAFSWTRTLWQLRDYFDKKFTVYQQMTKHQLWAAAIMAEEG